MLVELSWIGLDNTEWVMVIDRDASRVSKYVGRLAFLGMRRLSV